MSKAFSDQKLVIHPIPRINCPLRELLLASGIIIIAIIINLRLGILGGMAIPAGSLLISDAKLMKIGDLEDRGDLHQDPQDAVFPAPHAAKDEWIVKADMPTARHYFSTSTVNNRIYAIGGVAVNSPLSTVEEYDPSTDTWTKKADMPTARWGLSTCVVNDKIYAIGGLKGGVLSTVEEYDPITDKWIARSNMPTKRAGLTASAVNGKIYAIGGTDWDNALPIVEEYDPLTDTWSRKADMPTAREPSSVALNGKIYVIGGVIVFANGSVCLSTVEEYDPVSNIWTEKAKMPTKRAYLAACVAGEKIYAIGGASWWPVVTHTTVEEYDTISDKWMKVSDMPTARWGLSASVVNDRIYAMGGDDSNNVNLSVSEEYDTGYSSKIVESKEKLAVPWGEIKTK